MFNETKLEIFEACDKDGNKLGLDMVRGEDHEDGLYHEVVEILVVNHLNQVLVTKRDDKKLFPLYWEITGGSVIKGETTLEGAKRELLEETGLDALNLTLIYRSVEGDALFRGFITQVDSDKITLQKGETIDYKWLNPCDFIEFINREDFIPHARRRILCAWYLIEPVLFRNEDPEC